MFDHLCGELYSIGNWFHLPICHKKTYSLLASLGLFCNFSAVRVTWVHTTVKRQHDSLSGLLPYSPWVNPLQFQHTHVEKAMQMCVFPHCSLYTDKKTQSCTCTFSSEAWFPAMGLQSHGYKNKREKTSKLESCHGAVWARGKPLWWTLVHKAVSWEW